MPLLLLADEGSPDGGDAATRDASSLTAGGEGSPTGGGGGGTAVNLRRACSLSDLNKPNVARRVLPSPPNNGRNTPTYGPTFFKEWSSNNGFSEAERKIQGINILFFILF